MNHILSLTSVVDASCRVSPSLSLKEVGWTASAVIYDSGLNICYVQSLVRIERNLNEKFKVDERWGPDEVWVRVPGIVL